MICNYCSREIDDDSVFCTYCGKEMTTVSSEVTVEECCTANNVFAIRMQALRKRLAIGYGISLVTVLLFMIVNGTSFGLVQCIEAFLLVVLLGSLICAFLVAGDKSYQGLTSKCIKFLKNTFMATIVSVGGFNPLFLLWFIVKMMFNLILAIAIIIFVTISFPITVLYTIVMYFIEKVGIKINGGLISFLDTAIPIAAGIVTAFIIYKMF